MNDNIKQKLFVAALAITFLVSGCIHDKCGDGICQKREGNSGSCPEDCEQLYIKEPKDRLVKNITIFQEHSVHSGWSPDGNQIVFERINNDLYFQLYIGNTDGTNIQSFTDDNPNINQLNNGWPVWHPSDDFIVFQSEEPEHYDMGNRWLPFSGNGFYNNLWAGKIDGSKFWRLTDIEIKKTLLDGIIARSVVSPHFSYDGTKLMWTERYADGGSGNWGYWQVRMADVVIENDNFKLEPGEGKIIIRAEDICKECNYVNGMGFSPDKKKILLAGNLDGQHVFGMDQYIYDFESKKLTNLLNSPEYWEEGSCWSPDGKKIVYPTNAGSLYKFDFDNPDWNTQPKTREYWIMNADGSDKQQLTYFNTPTSPEYIEIGKGRRVIVAECKFSPDGNKLLGIIGIDKLTGDKSQFELSIGLIELD